MKLYWIEKRNGSLFPRQIGVIRPDPDKTTYKQIAELCEWFWPSSQVKVVEIGPVQDDSYCEYVVQMVSGQKHNLQLWT